ncbi:MAG TPA: universal stress protein [Amycolatopsis sp.]|uniref:universal stress protein n=1 Tax=Amycolatopsis sp. TaxID=37632 RepID=UPI002B4612A4|nr:universal stress protein [Amycolatopsis sp.]HKS49854.1 universal stress protein [Amycolatopsis sp.]
MTILVGVDGSPSSLHAVRWAATEAVRRRVPVRLLSVCPADAQVEQGHQVLRAAESLAREAAPGAEVRQELRVGLAAALLIEESAAAGLVVLGSRGLGGFAGMLVGSVSSGVAAHGRCPVVVVRGRTLEDPPPAGGPIVVGVDGSAVSDAAVEFAFDEARLRGVPLVAVHTWTDMSAGETWSVLPLDIDYEAVAKDEERLLAERMTSWRQKYPDVEVSAQVVRDRPVRGLLAAAEQAQLIVVGSRGRTALTGIGLGSTSQALLHHSTCPVAVARSISS